MEYIRPSDGMEARAILLNNPNAMVTAGGAELTVTAGNGRTQPECVVDIGGIEATRVLRFDDRGLYIGVSCTCSEVMDFAPVREYYPGLYDALSGLAACRTRDRAAVAGSLCKASPASDTAPILLAMGATLDVQGPAVWKKPLLELFAGAGENSLSQGEFVLGINVPKPEENERSRYYKKGKLKGEDMSVASMAVVYIPDCKLRMGFGSVSDTPVLVTADDLFGEEDMRDRLLKRVLGSIDPIMDANAARDDRIEAVRYFTLKVMDELEGRTI